MLPKLPGSRFTKLDGKLRKFRETELIGSKTKNGKEKVRKHIIGTCLCNNKLLYIYCEKHTLRSFSSDL